MKILVVIANFGANNDQYLARLLREYSSMQYRAHCVVLTNIEKQLGPDVEVVVRQPRGNPRTFPFLHKELLAERLEDYDLFIYTEDDTLITERNIQAFLSAAEALRDDEIAGFMRTEQGPDGKVYFSTIHEHFHWDPDSVVSRGGETFAHFTNQHSACYLLTQKQLRRAIESGGYLVEPHHEKFDLLESAATDPYTQCGFKKLICVSRIEDFHLPHLPNKYVGKIGIRDEELQNQVRAIEAIAAGTRPRTSLLNGETKLGHLRLSKSYYERASQNILDLIPAGARRVLSYGCGWGELEAELNRRGHHVIALPLDSVVGACAEARGIQVVYGESDSALAKIPDERFDCIIATDLIHRFPAPEKLLASFSKLLTPGGTVVASVPNLMQVGVWWRRIKRDHWFINLNGFEQAGIHRTSRLKVRRWFDAAGLTVLKVAPMIPDRARTLDRITGKICSDLLAQEFIFIAENR